MVVWIRSPLSRPRLFAGPGSLELKTKIVMLAVIPLLACFMILAWVVYLQERALAQRQRVLVETAYMQAKETELRNHVRLALTALQPLYRSSMPEAQAKAEAMRLLATMDFGSDGYFYLYEMDGKNIMHPRQRELIGRNLWDMQDPSGKFVIRELIAASKSSSGGFVKYLWRKPSTGQVAPKLGYVVSLERWNWMFGSGLYLDDIDSTLAQLDRQVKASITETMLFIAGVGLSGIVFIGVCGVVLNLRQHRVAYDKLRLMAHQVVRSQEDERAHLSRDLHDGTSQTLMSVRLLVESAIERWQHEPLAGPPPALQKALARLLDASAEVRRLSHRLRPAMLDTLGLHAALKHLGDEFAHASGVEFDITTNGDTSDLHEDITTVFFRVAQEALTNIEKHSGASTVHMDLVYGPKELRLTITDNGCGFDNQQIQASPNHGIGLRNMRERLVSIGGRCDIASTRGKTEVTARVPRSIVMELQGKDDA